MVRKDAGSRKQSPCHIPTSSFSSLEISHSHRHTSFGAIQSWLILTTLAACRASGILLPPPALWYCIHLVDPVTSPLLPFSTSHSREPIRLVSILIPAHNEAENLPELLPRVAATLREDRRPFEIIVVDDGSSDSTTDAAMQCKLPEVRIIRFRRNFGQTAALMAGIEHARGDAIVPIDADLQNLPEDIPALLRKLEEGFDVVSGWRKNRQDAQLQRNLPSRVANRLIALVAHLPLHDFGCSLKAYRSWVFEGVHLYGEMHRFVPLYAYWNGARITELPVNHAPRKHGSSHYGLKRVPKVLLDLLVVVFLHKFAQKPIYIFGGAGLLSFTIAALATVAAVYYKFFGNKSFVETPLPILAGITFVTGMMCVLMGFIAELLVRTYYESQGKRTYFAFEVIPPHSEVPDHSPDQVNT